MTHLRINLKTISVNSGRGSHRLLAAVVAATAVKARVRVRARRDRCRRRTLTVPTRRHWCAPPLVWTLRSNSRQRLQPRRPANTARQWTPRRRRRREGRTRWPTAMRRWKCPRYMTSTNRCRRTPMNSRSSSSSSSCHRTTPGKHASFLTGELADIIKPPAQ